MPIAPMMIPTTTARAIQRNVMLSSLRRRWRRDRAGRKQWPLDPHPGFPCVLDAPEALDAPVRVLAALHIGVVEATCVEVEETDIPSLLRIQREPVAAPLAGD